MKVLKFGGGCLKDAESIKKLPSILGRYSQDIIIVVSAFGKSTNLLQDIYYSKKRNFGSVVEFYRKLMLDLDFKDEIIDSIIIDCLKPYLSVSFTESSMLAIGELVSSSILSIYLKDLKFHHNLIDASKVVKTKDVGVSANIDWESTYLNIKLIYNNFLDKPIVPIITQGFIAGFDDGKSHQVTCLGREGSDYSASIFGAVLGAKQVVLFKDVDGLYDKDPKQHNHAKIFSSLSYDQAFIICNHPNTIIHPKTIQQLQKNRIPLLIKNFYDLNQPGTMIN